LNSEKLKEWFCSLDKTTQIQQIKIMSIRLYNLKKSMDNAIKAELDYGFNRVGTRGGKFCSLNAKAQNSTEMYLDCEESLKLMIKLL
jgi:hypothetical protein